MTWSKKLNSRAYDPKNTATLTTSTGSISTQSIRVAEYSIINDYLCLANLQIRFSLITAASTTFFVDLPLPFIYADPNISVGTGYIWDASTTTFKTCLAERNGSATSQIVVQVFNPASVNIGIGSNHELKLSGLCYAVR
jgi:hypothetical protein